MKQKTSQILLVIILIMVGCGKYEEGPGISFRSKRHRIEGKWNITSYVISNQEQLNYYEYGPLVSVKCQSSSNTVFLYAKWALVRSEWEIKKDGTYTKIWNYNNREIDHNMTAFTCKESYFPDFEDFDTEDGDWEFAKDKEYIIFKDKQGYRYEYEIIELREKRIQLKREDGTPKKIYLYTLEKK